MGAEKQKKKEWILPQTEFPNGATPKKTIEIVIHSAPHTHTTVNQQTRQTFFLASEIVRLVTKKKNAIGVPPARFSLAVTFSFGIEDWEIEIGKGKVLPPPAQPKIFWRRPPPDDPRLLSQFETQTIII